MRWHDSSNFPIPILSHAKGYKFKQERYFWDFCTTYYQIQRLLFQSSVFMKQKASRVSPVTPWFGVELKTTFKKKLFIWQSFELFQILSLINWSYYKAFIRLIYLTSFHHLCFPTKQIVYIFFISVLLKHPASPTFAKKCSKLTLVWTWRKAVTLLNHFTLTNKYISKQKTPTKVLIYN